MNDILKSKTGQATKTVSTKMTLDVALKTIEEANDLIKDEIAILASHPANNTIPSNDIIKSAAIKIGIVAAGSFAISIFGVENLGFDTWTVAAGPFLGIVTICGVDLFPEKFGLLFSPKMRKSYKRQAEVNNMFSELANEEFQRKENEILGNVKEAWDFANKELADQGYSILYSSNSGFSIESMEPLKVSQWDALRLEAVRAKGAKAAGIGFKG